jgi:hypothetical protein
MPSANVSVIGCVVNPPSHDLHLMTPTPGSPSKSIPGVPSTTGVSPSDSASQGDSSPVPALSGGDLVKDSLLYKEFVAERDEILRHKWLESEKAGHDIGFEKALLDWVLRYRAAWRLQRSSGGGLAGAR